MALAWTKVGWANLRSARALRIRGSRRVEKGGEANVCSELRLGGYGVPIVSRFNGWSILIERRFEARGRKEQNKEEKS